MRVLVTGGSGRLGTWVLRELAEHGYETVGADRRSPPDREADLDGGSSASHSEVDLTDVGQVAGAMQGCEAVVHLGAIPAPYRQPDEVVFANNAVSTYAVLQAAMLVGVRRAVVASSVSVLGHAFATPTFAPFYAPVDEEHPLVAQDPYGLSKEVAERTCAMFHRRCGMSIAALRFHHVTVPGEAASLASRLQSRPEAWAHQLWGYVDVRDAARACRLALEARHLGFDIFNIAAADTLGQPPTEDLLRRYCPQVKIREPIPDHRTAWSIKKARRLWGYSPDHSWRPKEGENS